MELTRDRQRRLGVHGAESHRLLGLGSNVGDRPRHLRDARDARRVRAWVTGSSSTYETEPVGEVTDQPDFLNACADRDRARTGGPAGGVQGDRARSRAGLRRAAPRSPADRRRPPAPRRPRATRAGADAATSRDHDIAASCCCRPSSTRTCGFRTGPRPPTPCRVSRDSAWSGWASSSRRPCRARNRWGRRWCTRTRSTSVSRVSIVKCSAAPRGTGLWGRDPGRLSTRSRARRPRVVQEAEQ